MTISDQIKTKIEKNGRGWCFTAHDFSEFGSNDAIRKALSRFVEIGYINRLSEGFYYCSQFHKVLGELPVKIEAVVDAMQRAHHIRCQPSGAYAANLLGLSEQVPAKVTILTDGASKHVQVGNREIQFKKTTPKVMALAGTITGLIVQAIKHIGKEHITVRHLRHLKARLSHADILILKQTAHLAPVWIAKLIMTEIVGDNDGQIRQSPQH